MAYIETLKTKLNAYVPNWVINVVAILIVYFILVWILKHFISDLVSQLVAVVLIAGSIGLYYFMNTNISFF